MKKDMTSPSVLKALMDKYGVAPLKRFGQNFLIDGNIADNIAEAAVPDGACALEIGPGMGALTARLLERASVLCAYEIDAGLTAALRELFADQSCFHLFHEDFLKADIDAQAGALFDGREVYVAANLPYYITTPCIMKLVQSRLRIASVTVMVQKEVAERLCAPPGSRNYGAITAALGYFAEPKLLFGVSASCFYPRPDVASAVVQLRIKQRGGDEQAQAYLQTVRALFAMRRKTVKSNLRQSCGLSNEVAAQVLADAGISENARSETLSVNDFKRVSETLKKISDFFERSGRRKGFNGELL